MLTFLGQGSRLALHNLHLVHTTLFSGLHSLSLACTTCMWFAQNFPWLAQNLSLACTTVIWLAPNLSLACTTFISLGPNLSLACTTAFGLHKTCPWLAQVAPRLAQLVLGRQVDPELEAMHVSGRAFRHLTVYDPSAGSHPLNTTRANHALQASIQ